MNEKYKQRYQQRDERFKAKVKELQKCKKWKPEHEEWAKQKGLVELLKD